VAARTKKLVAGAGPQGSRRFRWAEVLPGEPSLADRDADDDDRRTDGFVPRERFSQDRDAEDDAYDRGEVGDC
jgi:hypothetical protein